jgi:hypothetical protein
MNLLSNKYTTPQAELEVLTISISFQEIPDDVHLTCLNPSLHMRHLTARGAKKLSLSIIRQSSSDHIIVRIVTGVKLVLLHATRQFVR